MRYKYIFRRSPLLMKASGTSLDLGFMGFYKIIGSTRACINGTVVSPWTPPCKCGFNEAERRVNVSFSNSLTVLPDYKIKLNIKRNEPEPLDKCTVCFWGQDITKQVMKGLSAELDAAKLDLESQYGSVDLRPKFQQVWDMLNKVYNIYGLGWLQVNPKAIRINNIFGRNDSLNVYLGLSAKPVISFERPADQSSWVPPIAQFRNNPGFNIFLDAQLNYDSLSIILNDQVAGKEFALDKGPIKKSFVIKECKLFGAGNEKLIIRVRFSGSDDGTFYLLAKPSYNPSGKVLELKDIDFDIKSKNTLLSSADWLFNKRIVAEISRYARFDLAPYIDSAIRGINFALNKEWLKGIRSSGNISELRLVGIYPMSNHLIIRSNCTGNLSVQVDSILFSL
ncbi:MAG TPA: DUF4403 family protein, partial [Chitinophagaceae bacterium]|nr:DUF4403 family protein [Chitinophagaceae bacterium]